MKGFVANRNCPEVNKYWKYLAPHDSGYEVISLDV